MINKNISYQWINMDKRKIYRRSTIWSTKLIDPQNFNNLRPNKSPKFEL